MLLVEDNQELRSFLRSIFASTYRVVEASDGMEGWSKALKYLPVLLQRRHDGRRKTVSK